MEELIEPITTTQHTRRKAASSEGRVPSPVSSRVGSKHALESRGWTHDRLPGSGGSRPDLDRSPRCDNRHPCRGRAGIDPGAVRESIDQVATNRAVRRELARTLAADPQLLTSGRPEGPVALGKPIVPCWNVVRCLWCCRVVPTAASRTLPALLGRLRICTGCDAKRRAARKAPCSGCGRHMVCRYRDRDGESLCAGCRPKDDHLGLDRLCEVLGELVMDLEPDMIRAAVTTVLKRPHHRRRMIWELEDRPELVTGAGAQGSLKMIALIEALTAAGSRQVVIPACPLCDRQLPLRGTAAGSRVCARCDGRARQQPCGRCGRMDKVSGRSAAGEALCRSCYHREPINHESCAHCGRRRSVSSHNDTANHCATAAPRHRKRNARSAA